LVLFLPAGTTALFLQFALAAFSNGVRFLIREGGEILMAQDFERLQMLLKYELGLSVRHYRPMSLILIESECDGGRLGSLLSAEVRGSDQLFETATGVAVLMGQTAPAGAELALARYQARCREEGGLRTAMASYPADGQRPEQILRAAQQRLSNVAAPPSRTPTPAC
jgi:hypothetical protein